MKRRPAPHKPPDCSLKLSVADKLVVQAEGRLAVVAIVVIVGLLLLYGADKATAPLLGWTEAADTP